MLLNSIKLKNFRQFKGEQEVNFSTDGSRNLTVLLGDNTAGKTTLIQAFRWGLYDSVNFKSKEKLLNSDVELNMRKGDVEDVSVTISLVHEGLEYHIERSQRFISYESGLAKKDSAPKFTIHCMENCQFKRIKDEYGNMIEKILPNELSDYFFFDGEKISNVSDKKNLKEAVTSLMGLTPVKNMISHLNPKANDSVYGELSKRLVSTGNKELPSLRKQEESLKNGIESDRDTLSRRELEKAAYDDAYFRALKALEENQIAVDKAYERTELDKKLKSHSTKLNTHINEVKSDFNNLNYHIFINPLMKKALDLISSVDMDDKGIPDMNSRSIDYILKRGYCICGTDLNVNKGAKDEIFKQKEFLPPQSIGTTIRDFTHQIKDNGEKLDYNFIIIKRSYGSIIETKSIIDEKTTMIEDIDEYLRKQPDVSDLETAYQNAKKNQKSISDNITDLKTRIKFNEENLKKISEDILKIVENDGVNDATLRQMEYVKVLYTRMINIYDSKSNRILENMNNTVKDVFSKMYHGKRDIDIDEEYRVHISVDKSGKLDASTGLDVVKNFAFIAALLKLAKESINDEEMQSEPYPMVMDAPFSNADAIHIANISKLLPDVAEQVIMMIMDKDWYHVNPVVKDHIGNVYRLNKLTESHTVIEVETI